MFVASEERKVRNEITTTRGSRGAAGTAWMLCVMVGDLVADGVPVITALTVMVGVGVGMELTEGLMVGVSMGVGLGDAVGE